MVMKRSSMSPMELRERLRGVVAFPVTPFHEDGSLDLDGLSGNLSRLLSHDMGAIVAAGGTGELYSLDFAEHEAVVRRTVDMVDGRWPVIAGVGGNVAIATELARRAAAAGADGILALPPYYPHADEDGLLAYYHAIGDATPLGFIVYSRDWVNPGPAFVGRLASLPGLAAWKDGQGDVRRLQALMTSVGDRLHWIGGAGDDLVPAYYRLGIRTYTSSIANVAPRLSLELHERAAAGDEAGLQQLMAYVVPLYALRGRRKGYEVSVMKAMMELMGQAAGPVRPPLVEITAAEREELKAMLARWREWLD
jgi:5-dehydro-4-deoxyglucarate dehydratase